MASDPKLLYAIDGINAYHLADGQEELLTPAGGQTLSLLMVPTASGFADPTAASEGTGLAAEDFYLHLHLPPELDLPLPATTQIYSQPPTSYLIPRWDLGPDSGAFTRLEFPPLGSRPSVQEDVDTFETILAQCTAFLERAPPPKPRRPKTTSRSASSMSVTKKSKAQEAGDEELPPYNPADYAPGQAYAQGSSSSNTGGKIVLVDEDDGSVIGELSEGYQIVESGLVKPGSKDPVEVALPADGSQNISVQPVSQEYVEMQMHPAFKKSHLVSGASRASQLLITTTTLVTNTLASQADNFTKNTKPVAKPVTFSPSTHSHIRRINTFSGKAASMSAAGVGAVSKVAQNLGANFALRKDGRARGYDKDGNLIDSYRPGILNKSLMAFNTVVDGMEQAGKNLLTGTSESASTVVGHRWGAEAGEVAANIGGGFKNVGLVYIDVTGVSRRAVLKSVAKGMIVGKVKDGRQVVVGGGDGSNPEGLEKGESSTAQIQDLQQDSASVYSSRPHDTYGDGVSVAGSEYDPKARKPSNRTW
ncbi:hypothetical protein CC79DRAFT_1292991 [Sarocladium strictum]